MSYSEYRNKLRMLTAKYIEAYKKYGWNAETTRKLRQQKKEILIINMSRMVISIRLRY